jgi:hypothetical protein
MILSAWDPAVVASAEVAACIRHLMIPCSVGRAVLVATILALLLALATTRLGLVMARPIYEVVHDFLEVDVVEWVVGIRLVDLVVATSYEA